VDPENITFEFDLTYAVYNNNNNNINISYGTSSIHTLNHNNNTILYTGRTCECAFDERARCWPVPSDLML